jgi:tetratricopeptide (TPR) repeat protein
MHNVLSHALSLHQAGKLALAAKLYAEVLAQQQHNADALRLLGVLHHQQGDHARAVDEIGRAVALAPSVPSNVAQRRCQSVAFKSNQALGGNGGAGGVSKAGWHETSLAGRARLSRFISRS